MRIAIFLRGHKRNWEYTKHSLLTSFEKLAEHVDYYVAVWKNRSDLRTMIDDFPKDRLKVFFIVPNDTHYNSLSGPAFQTSLLNKHKVLEEMKSGEKYDLIIDTRFDTELHILSELEKPQPYSLGYSTWNPIRHMDDAIFICDNKSIDIWNARGLYSKFQADAMYTSTAVHNGYFEVHKWYYNYAEYHNLNIYQIPWLKCDIVRPSLEYNSLPTKERQKLILEMGMELEDFSRHLDDNVNGYMIPKS